MVTENRTGRKNPNHFVIFGNHIRDIVILDEYSGELVQIQIPESGSLLVNLGPQDESRTTSTEEH